MNWDLKEDITEMKKKTLLHFSKHLEREDVSDTVFQLLGKIGTEKNQCRRIVENGLAVEDQHSADDSVNKQNTSRFIPPDGK